MKVLALVIAICIATMISSCGATRSSQTKAPCVTTERPDIVIAWRTEDDSLRTSVEYTMYNNGDITRSVRTASDSTTRLCATVSHDAYCDMAKNVNGTFVKVQALRVRGKRARSIDYFSVTGNVYLRATWNPDLQTFQSRDFRELYETLMALVPKEDV